VSIAFSSELKLELELELERLGFAENIGGTLRITDAGRDAWQQQRKP